MEFLQNLLDSTSFPALSAFLLGLMMAVSPCPMATNITAIGFISRDIEKRNVVFINGLVYTLGRTVSYTLLGIILFLGANQFKLANIFSGWGEKILGPLLMIIGLIMLNLIRINLPGFNNLTNKIEQKEKKKYMDVFLLGVIFALAFCPYSAVLYFGMLIPMTIVSASGLYLPVVFSIATGLPVIIVAWLIAYTISGIGSFYNKLKAFDFWFRRVVAVLFIGVGVYLTILFWL